MGSARSNIFANKNRITIAGYLIKNNRKFVQFSNAKVSILGEGGKGVITLFFVFKHPFF